MSLTNQPFAQIEGFKLHVNHLTRPYFARLRQAPEVASTPQRIEKDLQQIKQLAVLLEDEYATLRRLKEGAPEPKTEDIRSHGADGEQADVVMADPATNGTDVNGLTEAEPELEPLDKGSEAVDRRVEKLVAEMQAQREIAEESGVESTMITKKVRCGSAFFIR